MYDYHFWLVITMENIQVISHEFMEHLSCGHYMCDVVSQISRHSRLCWNIWLHATSRAQSPSPDGRYQSIWNVRTYYEPLDFANVIFDRCVATRSCQQTLFNVRVEYAGANRVLIVPEDSGSHRHRDDAKLNFEHIQISKWLKHDT